MRLKCLTIIASIFMPFAGYAKAQTWITNGLVAYYPFNGNANDASENGNNGTLNGATSSTDRFGSATSSYLFNGGQSIVTPLSSPSGKSGRSVTGWFQTANKNKQAILGYGGLADVSVSGNRFEVGVTSQGLYLDVSFGTIVWTGNFTDKVWHQFAVLVEANAKLQDVQLFVDGIRATNWSSDVPDRTINTSTSYPMEIGDLFILGDDRRFLSGQIDDVRIYNRTLSSNEVVQLYQYDSSPLSPSGFPHTATAEPASPANLQLNTYPGLQVIGTVGRTYQVQSSAGQDFVCKLAEHLN